MIHLKQHVPNFIETDEARQEADVDSAADLAAIEWIQRWARMPEFHRWSQSSSGSSTLLIAEVDGGHSQWVVAYADKPFADLPTWEIEHRV